MFDIFDVISIPDGNPPEPYDEEAGLRTAVYDCMRQGWELRAIVAVVEDEWQSPENEESPDGH